MKVRENNIDYAIDAIKYGTKRELIISDLIASHRAMDMTDATNMLNDLYAAFGGEHKKGKQAWFYLWRYVFSSFYSCVNSDMGK